MIYLYETPPSANKLFLSVKKIRIARIILGLALILNSVFLYGQNDSKNYYKWFDQEVGIENTGLYNGIRYYEKFRIRNGKHKFLDTPEFQKGDIVYCNQPYFDIELKYDLFEGQIVIMLNKISGTSILQLYKEEIQSFQLGKRKFVYLENIEGDFSTVPVSDFFEELSGTNQLVLYKKHKKVRNKYIVNKVIYSEFKTKNEYYVSFEDGFYELLKKSDWHKLFPEHKKVINGFYRDYKDLLKSDYDLFLIRLADKLNQISPNLNSD